MVGRARIAAPRDASDAPSVAWVVHQPHVHIVREDSAMKKLLLLGAIGYAAFRFGKHVALRDASPTSRRLARADFDEVFADEAQDALAEAARFEARQVALADLALARSPAGALRSVATMLREEHGSGLDRADSLQSPAGAPFGGADAEVQPALARLEGLDDTRFEDAWLATVTHDHSRMLESLDDVLLPSGDVRIDEHLRAVRDHVQAHLQHLLALQGANDDPAARVA